MKISRQNKRQHGGGGGGFTLIEVVLVLAIGGLIFLLAFLAFGQATKNRRDTARRSEAARVISEVENAKGDGNGTAFNDDTTFTSFVKNYLGAAGTSPTFTYTTKDNITYTIKKGDNAAFLADTFTITSSTALIYANNGSKCSGSTMGSGGAGDYAALVKLEKGVVCRDNQ